MILPDIEISDGNTANSIEDDGIENTPSEDKPEVRTWYERIYADPADSIFWYGFGQGMVQLFGGSNTALSAYLSEELCQDWNYIKDQYELELHSEVQYSEKDIETMEAAGLSEEDIEAVTEVVETYSVNSGSIIIPAKSAEVTHVEYGLTYYVNDINTANEQVLMTYGRNDSETSAYIYGNGRLWEDNCQSDEQNNYVYDGRGSVVQVTSGVSVEMSILYDPFGNILSGVDENFVGFAYNGEETNQAVGLQYLRARYYDTELGSFLTIDSYLGSLTDIVSQNRYTYANNNPVNNIDPSGHSSTSVNGINQYYDSNSLNQIRSYATATALWSAQLNAQNAFNNAVTTASNTAYQNYASINTISQATANSYINNGIAKAQQVSMNYGCSTGAVGNAAVERFKSVIEAAKSSANEKIEGIKVTKGVEYIDYLDEVKKESLKEVLDSNPPHEGSVVTELIKKKYDTEFRSDINGIGMKEDGTIIVGNNATYDDAITLALLAQWDNEGKEKELIYDFIQKYLNKKKESGEETSIQANKTIGYYKNIEDITMKLWSEMIKNEYENTLFFNEGKLYGINEVPLLWVSYLMEFKEKVGNKGEWDLKQKEEWNASSLYYFNGELVDKDAPGNIMYGYMGKAYGIPDNVLYLAAGYAQVSAGTSKAEFMYSNFDDPMDQINIRRGIEFYNETHKNK